MKKTIVAIVLIALTAYMLWSLVGKQAPDLPLFNTTLYDENNQVVPADSFIGKVLIVSYFQTWCGDCRREQPELMQLQNSVGEDQLKLVFISDESFDKINRMKEYLQVNIPFYRSEKTLKELGVNRYPTTYLIDKSGKVVDVKVEGIDWYNDKNIQLIQKLNK